MDTLPPPQPRRRGTRRGFTLIETATAMVIISVAVVAMCGLLTAGTAVNISANELTTAINLAGTIHELALELPLVDAQRPVIGPYRGIWDLHGREFSPPIDGSAVPIPDYPDWMQQVIVQSVDNKNDSAIADDRSAAAVRLTVTIYHRGHYVYAQSWLMTADDPL